MRSQGSAAGTWCAEAALLLLALCTTSVTAQKISFWNTAQFSFTSMLPYGTTPSATDYQYIDAGKQGPGKRSKSAGT